MAGEGGYGVGPWGGVPWGGALEEPPPPPVEHIPYTVQWDIFDLGGIRRDDIDRLTDFIETYTGGSPGQLFVSSWNIASGGAYPTTLAYTGFNVAVTETFTVEYSIKFNALPDDFSDPINVHMYLGAWSSQDFAVGLLISKVGVAYTGEVTVSGGSLVYAQPIDMIPGSEDWLPSIIAEGAEVTIRAVVDSSLPVLYLYITRTSELPTTGHVLRALLQPKATLPGTVDNVLIAVRGSLTDESNIELINDYRMSTKALIPNVAPVAIAGEDQAQRLCSIVQLDGSASFDPEGNALTYEWRLIDAPDKSIYTFVGVDGSTQFSPSGYVKRLYSPSMATAHAAEPIVPGDVVTIAGEGYTIQTIYPAAPFSVDVEYTQLPSELNNIRYKLFRQAGINRATPAKPTFYPDVAGVYLFDLRVFDGALWSSPLGLDRSRTLVDVRESALPRNCQVDTSFVFNCLPSFWGLVEDRARISSVWDAIAQATSSELLTVWQHEYSKSLKDIQRQAIRKWLHYDLMLPEPLPELSKLRYLWSGVLSNRFTQANIAASTIVVSIPFYPDPIVLDFMQSGNLTPTAIARELETLLRERVNDAFRVQVLDASVLIGGDGGTVIDTGVLANNVFFTSTPTNSFAGILVGDSLHLYDSVGVETIHSITAVSYGELVVATTLGVAGSGRKFKITRGLTQYSVLRVSFDGPFTFTSDSTCPLFVTPVSNAVYGGLQGYWVGDRVFKTSKPLYDVVEDDLLVVGDTTYRIRTVLTSSVDEYEYQRVVVKESNQPSDQYLEWAIPGWVSSKLIDFYSGLFVRGDITEFEVVLADGAYDIQPVPILGVNEAKFDRAAIDTAALALYGANATAINLARGVRRTYIPVDELVVDVPTLQENIVVEDDANTLRRNVDYFLEEFRGHNALRIQSGRSTDEGDVWEGYRPPDRLWAEFTYIDNNPTVEANFGYLIDVLRENVPEGVDYLPAVQGLWYVVFQGPTVRNIRVSAQILLGLPFAETAGVIEEIRSEFLSSSGRMLIRDADNAEIVRSYVYPVRLGLEVNPATGETYKVGDSVEQFAPLVTGVEVQDYVTNPTWFSGLLSQGLFYEVQKFHTFLVRIDYSAFSVNALIHAQSFIKRVKPVYTDTKFLVSFKVSGDGDEIDIIDKAEYSGRLVLDDALCARTLGGAYNVDESWSSGSEHDPPANTDPDRANHWRHRVDVKDAELAIDILPIYPTPQAADWALDSGGYLCPNDVLEALIIQGFAAPTPMIIDSIFFVDVGETYTLGAVTYEGPSLGQNITVLRNGPFSVTEAGIELYVDDSTPNANGDLRGLCLTFVGATLLGSTDADDYELDILVDSVVQQTELLSLAVSTDVHVTLAIPVTAGQVVKLTLRSPSGDGTKTPAWSVVKGWLINDQGPWYVDMGEPAYPLGPVPAPPLLPAGVYCSDVILVPGAAA